MLNALQCPKWLLKSLHLCRNQRQQIKFYDQVTMHMIQQDWIKCVRIKNNTPQSNNWSEEDTDCAAQLFPQQQHHLQPCQEDGVPDMVIQNFSQWLETLFCQKFVEHFQNWNEEHHTWKGISMSCRAHKCSVSTVSTQSSVWPFTLENISYSKLKKPWRKIF